MLRREGREPPRRPGSPSASPWLKWMTRPMTDVAVRRRELRPWRAKESPLKASRTMDSSGREMERGDLHIITSVAETFVFNALGPLPPTFLLLRPGPV